MRMVVDLPAPFGPRKPSTSPRSTLKEMSSTARFAPNDFTRFSTLIILFPPFPGPASQPVLLDFYGRKMGIALSFFKPEKRISGSQRRASFPSAAQAHKSKSLI